MQISILPLSIFPTTTPASPLSSGPLWVCPRWFRMRWRGKRQWRGGGWLAVWMNRLDAWFVAPRRRHRKRRWSLLRQKDFYQSRFFSVTWKSYWFLLLSINRTERISIVDYYSVVITPKYVFNLVCELFFCMCLCVSIVNRISGLPVFHG